MVLFAFQGKKIATNLPTNSHTFATFIKADRKNSERKTISWFPKSGFVDAFKLLPEPGVNLTLEQSVKLANNKKLRRAYFGPFEIQKTLYDAAVTQEDRLEKKLVEYKTTDRQFRPDIAVNCQHAVSDMWSDGELLNTGILYGIPGTEKIGKYFSKWIINQATSGSFHEEHPEILDILPVSLSTFSHPSLSRD